MKRQLRTSVSVATYSRQLSVYLMYVLLFLCLGFVLQTLFKFERLSDDDIVNKYLLRRSDELLRLSSKPKLWIPFPKDQNRLQQGLYWKSFLDRSTEPDEVQIQYLQLSLRTIERHNAEQFQIVLVDDSTFAKLIPAWQLNRIDIEKCTSEGMKQHLRRIGMLQLMYLYGGMVIPPSFLCLGGLYDTYVQFTENGVKPFFAETVCENGKIGPSTRIMGAPAKHYFIKDMIEMLVRRSFPDARENKLEFPYNYQLRMLIDQHYEHSEAFRPFLAPWITDKARKTRDCNILPGELVCVCTARKSSTTAAPRKIIDVEQWFYRVSDVITEQTFTVLERNHDRVRGVDFPLDRAMLRRNYRWIAKTKVSEIMRMNNVLATVIKYALDDRRMKNDAEILGL